MPKRPAVDGLRRRPAAFVGLTALVTVAVALSVVSPLLVRAALQSALAHATPTGALAVVVRQQSGSDLQGKVVTPTDVLSDTSRWRVHPASIVAGPRTVWERTGDSRRYAGALTGSPSCGTVTIVRGTCPAAATDVALPDVGIGVGASITIVTGTPATLRVVGIYRRGPDGGPFTEAGAVAAEEQDGPRVSGIDLLLTPAGLKALQVGTVTTRAVTLARPLRLEEVASVRKTVARAGLIVYDPSVTVSAPIVAVLDAQAVATEAATLIALALVLQALAVTWAAQAVFVSATARARAVEWGVARLRGFRLGRRMLIVFAEPLIAIAIGAVAGFLIAVLLARLVTDPAIPVQPTEPIPLLAAAAAIAGCVVALVLASVRSATIPLERLLRQRVDPVQLSRIALVAQAGVLIATVLVIVAAATGGALAGAQLPLLAPALVAVSIGLIGLRIAVALLRGRSGALPRTAFGLLVVRRLARSPFLLAPAVLVCVATGVAVSAAQTAAVSDRTVQAEAAAAVGAERVLTVETDDRAGLITAVRRADPSGQRAMAVELAGGGPDLIAVDTARLGAVAAWDPAWSGRSASALHRALDPATPGAIRLTGSTVRVGLSGVRTDSADPADLRVQLVVDGGSGWRTVTLGTLARTTLTAAIPCTAGCRVVSLQVANTQPASPWHATFTIAQLSTDRQPASDLTSSLTAKRWRQDVDANSGQAGFPTVGVRTVAAGLQVGMQDDEPAAVPAIAPRDGLQPLPALLGPQSILHGVDGLPGSYYGVGADLETVFVRPVGRAAALPRSLATGQLVDLEALDRVSDPSTTATILQVWLGPGATAATVRALRANGLTVIREQRLTEVLAADRQDVVPVTTRDGAAIGIATLVLAIAALPAVELLRRRGIALRARTWTDAAGSRRGAARLAFLGIVLPAAAGVVLGVAAGVAAVATIIRLLPLAPGSTVTLPIDTLPAWPAIAIPVLLAAVLLPVLGAVTTTLGMRR